jgi:rubrerythrin
VWRYTIAEEEQILLDEAAVSAAVIEAAEAQLAEDTLIAESLLQQERERDQHLVEPWVCSECGEAQEHDTDEHADGRCASCCAESSPRSILNACCEVAR